MTNFDDTLLGFAYNGDWSLNTPDVQRSQAEIIRNLMDRLELLEEEVRDLKGARLVEGGAR